jgi:hypothetical protein
MTVAGFRCLSKIAHMGGYGCYGRLAKARLAGLQHPRQCLVRGPASAKIDRLSRVINVG